MTTIYYTAQDALQAVIAAEGNMYLAAERLFGIEDSPAEQKARLVKLIAEDPTAQQELQRTLRTLSLVEAFSTFMDVSAVVKGTLDQLDAPGRAKLMKQLLDSMSILTDDHTQTVNSNQTRLNLSLTEAVYKQLPPDIQQALKALQEPASDEGVVDTSWAELDAPSI
jgi:hypothetical protein